MQFNGQPNDILSVVTDPNAAGALATKTEKEAAALKRAEENDAVNASALIFGRHKTMQEAEGTYKEQQSTITKLQQELSALKKAPSAPTKKTVAAPESPVAPSETPTGTPASPPALLGQEALSKYVSEFQESGDLSEESYIALRSVGIGDDLAKAYVAGQHAQQQLIVNNALAPVGGREEYKKLLEWGNRVLDKASKDAFDVGVQDLSSPLASEMIMKLKRTYDLAHGKFPTAPIESEPGTPPSSDGHGGYGSYEEMATDMKDPRYSGVGGRRDPAFIAKVQKRVSKSKSL